MHEEFLETFMVKVENMVKSKETVSQRAEEARLFFLTDLQPDEILDIIATFLEALCKAHGENEIEVQKNNKKSNQDSNSTDRQREHVERPGTGNLVASLLAGIRTQVSHSDSEASSQSDSGSDGFD